MCGPEAWARHMDEGRIVRARSMWARCVWSRHCRPGVCGPDAWARARRVGQGRIVWAQRVDQVYVVQTCGPGPHCLGSTCGPGVCCPHLWARAALSEPGVCGPDTWARAALSGPGVCGPDVLARCVCQVYVSQLRVGQTCGLCCSVRVVCVCGLSRWAVACLRIIHASLFWGYHCARGY
jgi:hypothetical protein